MGERDRYRAALEQIAGLLPALLPHSPLTRGSIDAIINKATCATCGGTGRKLPGDHWRTHPWALGREPMLEQMDDTKREQWLRDRDDEDAMYLAWRRSMGEPEYRFPWDEDGAERKDTDA